jgi:hypothetical protein
MSKEKHQENGQIVVTAQVLKLKAEGRSIIIVAHDLYRVLFSPPPPPEQPRLTSLTKGKGAVGLNNRCHKRIVLVLGMGEEEGPAPVLST